MWAIFLYILYILVYSVVKKTLDVCKNHMNFVTWMSEKSHEFCIQECAYSMGNARFIFCFIFLLIWSGPKMFKELQFEEQLPIHAVIPKDETVIKYGVQEHQ